MKYINDIYSAKAFHWLMFLKNNNLGFLKENSLSQPPHNVIQDNTEEAIESYRCINDQIINCFGIEESFEAHKQKLEDIAKLKLDFIINGKKQNRTMWRLKEFDMQTPEEHNKKQYDLEKEIEIVSKSIGSGIINIKDYTIHQFLIAKNSLKNGK